MQHKHLIVKAKIENPPQRNDVGIMESWLIRFVKSNGMKIQRKPILSYVLDRGNRGLTGCCLIKTSHVSFHVWDEQDPALIQFDFYNRELVSYVIHITTKRRGKNDTKFKRPSSLGEA